MQKLLAILFVVLTLQGTAQTYPLIRFRDTTQPTVFDARWYKLNNSGHEFAVAFSNGQLTISAWKYNSSVVTYSLGKDSLLGVDYGEFGGGLYYVPADTTRKNFFINGRPGPTANDPFRGGLLTPSTNPLTQRLKGKFQIMRGNIKFIFRCGDSLYLMGGLAHMSMNVGGLSTLDIKGDSFTVARSFNLGAAPMAMAVYNNAVYVATDDGFSIIRKGKIEQVFSKLFWSGLYPNSIALIDERHIYVGMRGGYAIIDAPARMLQFYQYIP